MQQPPLIPPFPPSFQWLSVSPASKKRSATESRGVGGGAGGAGERLGEGDQGPEQRRAPLWWLGPVYAWATHAQGLKIYLPRNS